MFSFLYFQQVLTFDPTAIHMMCFINKMYLIAVCMFIHDKSCDPIWYVTSTNHRHTQS